MPGLTNDWHGFASVDFAGFEKDDVRVFFHCHVQVHAVRREIDIISRPVERHIDAGLFGELLDHRGITP